ncbi:hypothetical protein LSM04_008218 [Trypanosoma melophagium]|uniref:uncharacterized protein n=1 Tax=Trypanosoma melophagium TaxID=715481 RepID=UPI00351A5E7C|nr:hypothetical protein LSM04_008218 [Trypanosoma melophagium]
MVLAVLVGVLDALTVFLGNEQRNVLSRRSRNLRYSVLDAHIFPCEFRLVATKNGWPAPGLFVPLEMVLDRIWLNKFYSALAPTH